MSFERATRFMLTRYQVSFRFEQNNKRKKKKSERDKDKCDTNLQIVNSAVMNVTRGVIEVFVSKVKTMSFQFEFTVLGPVFDSA